MTLGTQLRYLLTATVATVLLAINLPTSAADNELTDKEKAQGWRLLFNGQDHTGWKTNNGREITSQIEDGCLQSFKNGGYVLVHEEEFGDFILKCDVKMSEKCNSGIFFRVGKLLDPVYSGFEAQVLEGEGTGVHDFGALYDLVAPTHNASKPAGEWNQVQIVCRGPLVVVSVNGDVVSMMNVDEWDEKGKRPDGTPHKFRTISELPRKGYLGFQDHGHPCWYKNVKVLVLDEADKPAAE